MAWLILESEEVGVATGSGSNLTQSQAEPKAGKPSQDAPPFSCPRGPQWQQAFRDSHSWCLREARAAWVGQWGVGIRDPFLGERVVSPLERGQHSGSGRVVSEEEAGQFS